MLRDADLRNADREYVKILYCAARHSEEMTAIALEQLIAKGCIVSHVEVETLVKWFMQQSSPPPRIEVIDRLVHHSVILELNVPSYRMEQAIQRGKTSPNKNQ